MAAELEGIVAVVTGGARGFGKAFGTALAERGAMVALVDLDEDAVRETANGIGANALPFAGDVTDQDRMSAIMGEVTQGGGGIDILINNAGLHSDEYSRPIEEMGLSKVRRLFDVNVMGVTACTLAAAPYMAVRNGANVLNISS